jgi:TonB-linked SusC/RagA family outer membrane protein
MIMKHQCDNTTGIYDAEFIKFFCFKVSPIFLFFVLISIPLWAQQQQENAKKVHGIVKSTSGLKLAGANILVKGTTTGTATDAQGAFQLTVSSLQDTLRVTYIGYYTKFIPIKGRTNINIVLKSKLVGGKELVVTAFGKEKSRESVVGAITSVNKYQLNQIKSTPTANITTTLAGRIPGLIAYQRGGAPGSNSAQFFVRGVQSFGYGNSPLILIDGVRSTTNQLAQLNPNDIAEFSILKDATATALYGSQAANGVLIIKTKTGEKRQSIVTNIRVSNNITMPTQVPKFADPVTYMTYANMATRTRNPLATLPYSQRKIDKTRAAANPYLYPAVNWRDMLFSNYADNQMYALNIAGGGDIATYYVSGSYNKEQGLLKVPRLNNFNNNIAVNNYSLRSNVNVNLTKTTMLAFKINGIFQSFRGPLQEAKSVYHLLVNANPVRFPPVFPVDSAHIGVTHPLFGNVMGGEGGTVLYANPYAQMVRGYQTRHESTINAQFRVKQDLGELVKGLEIGGLITVQRFSQRGAKRHYSPYYYSASATSINNVSKRGYTLALINPTSGDDHLSYSPSTKRVRTLFQIRSRLNYKRTFGKGQNVSAFLVFKARNQIKDNGSTAISSLPYRNVDWAGRLAYNYKHRYYVEADLGVTGSERFAPGHRYGLFPSFGIKYNISNEKYWNPIQPIISLLDFRLTYGFGGNDNFSTAGQRFLYLSTVDFSAPGYSTGVTGGNSISGINVTNYPNPFIGWERKKQINLGIDIGIYHHLTIHSNFYKAVRSNILQRRVNTVVALGLITNPLVSYGTVQNHGVSTRLVYHQSYGNNWLLRVRGNFTFARNEITKFSENIVLNSPNVLRVGQPIDQIYGLYADRLFIDQEDVENSPVQSFGPYGPGDIKYRDINGDGSITDNDILPIGYPAAPEINYGFGFSLYYKNIDFSSFFEGLAHESFFINTTNSSTIKNQGTAPYVGGHQLLKAYAENHWTTQNRNVYALYPRFSTKNANEGVANNSRESTWFLRNGAFLRIKKVEIGYSLSDKITTSLGLKQVRFYANSTNLYHFSKFKLWDPEMAGNGLGYPLQTTYNLGIHVKF